MDRVRYRAYQDGPDPLAPPLDIRGALDEVGRGVMAGARPGDALREVLRTGPHDSGGQGSPAGLEELRRRVRERIERLLDIVLREVLDEPPPGMRQAAGGNDTHPTRADGDLPPPLNPHRLRAMLTALNDMLAAEERGEHSPAAFDRFMAQFADFFPERPPDLDHLIDTLARRAATAQRALDSLTPEQRAELTSLADHVIGSAGLGTGLNLLAGHLRTRRNPDLARSGATSMDGIEVLGRGEAASAWEELVDLTELDTALGQDYPGAALEDIDDDAVRRALGQSAVDSVARLRAIERGLREEGYLRGTRNRPQLTPKALRRLGETALRDILTADRPGDRRVGGHSAWNGHSAAPVGWSGEPTGTSCPTEPGDERAIDVVRTLGNAIARGRSTPDGGIRPRMEDIEVTETEHRTAAAVCLLVDLSYSMVRRGLWTSTKQTAMALHTLVTTRFPQDAVRIIGFNDHAREIPASDLAELTPDRVQGTNLQHALALAGRHLDRHPDFTPIVLIVTDGEPTAHLAGDGSPAFQWPPSAQTTAATLAEVDRMTRRDARLRIVLLADDPRLRTFADDVARRNGGDVVQPDSTMLGAQVVHDFLARRRGIRRGQ